jgi:hypothetical protein
MKKGGLFAVYDGEYSLRAERDATFVFLGFGRTCPGYKTVHRVRARLSDGESMSSSLRHEGGVVKLC